jgi:hypothetical protein
MMALKALLDLLNHLQINRALYKSLTDLVTVKLEAPQLWIRAAKKWGILILSTSFHYDNLKERTSFYIPRATNFISDSIFVVVRFSG